MVYVLLLCIAIVVVSIAIFTLALCATAARADTRMERQHDAVNKPQNGRHNTYATTRARSTLRHSMQHRP